MDCLPSTQLTPPGNRRRLGAEAGSEAGVLPTPGGRRPSLPGPSPPAPGRGWGGRPSLQLVSRGTLPLPSAPPSPLSLLPAPPLALLSPRGPRKRWRPRCVPASALLLLPQPLPSDPETSVSPGPCPPLTALPPPGPAPSLWTPSLGVTFLARADDTPACSLASVRLTSVRSDRPGGGVLGAESPTPLHPRDPRSDPHAAPPWPQGPWFPPQKLPASIPGPLTPVFPCDLSGPWVSCPLTFDPAGLTLGSLIYKMGMRPPELRGHPPTTADTTLGYKDSTTPATALVSPAVVGEMFDK